MDYIVLEVNNIASIENEVSRYIKLGFIPMGGISVTSTGAYGNGTNYCQAVTKGD